MEIQGIDIQWLGHDCFKITHNGKNIYIDPFQLKETKKDADYILLTHPHYDHCSIEDIQKIAKDGAKIIIPTDCQSKITRLTTEVQMIVISVGEKRTIDNIQIDAVPAYNIDKFRAPGIPFHPKDDGWLGYILTIDNKKIYHTGDSDNIPEMTNIKGIDIALLPVSGKYVMTAEEAADAASIIKPKTAIPMHYGAIIGDENDADKFLQLCKAKGINAERIIKS